MRTWFLGIAATACAAHRPAQPPTPVADLACPSGTATPVPIDERSRYDENPSCTGFPGSCEEHFVAMCGARIDVAGAAAATTCQDDAGTGAFVVVSAAGRTEGACRGGVLDGVWRATGPDGGVLAQGRYVDGRRDGPWVEAELFGRLETEYKAGVLDGGYREYRRGVLAIEASYRDGRLDGVRTTWADGRKIAEEVYRAGAFVSQRMWWTDGTPRIDCAMSDDGAERCENDDEHGARRVVAVRAAGAAAATWTLWYPDGAVLATTTTATHELMPWGHERPIADGRLQLFAHDGAVLEDVTCADGATSGEVAHMEGGNPLDCVTMFQLASWSAEDLATLRAARSITAPARRR